MLLLRITPLLQAENAANTYFFNQIYILKKSELTTSDNFERPSVHAPEVSRKV